MSFRALAASEVRAFLAAKPRIRLTHHAMTRRFLHWAVCANCGLVGLRTTRTDQRDCAVEA